MCNISMYDKPKLYRSHVFGCKKADQVRVLIAQLYVDRNTGDAYCDCGNV